MFLAVFSRQRMEVSLLTIKFAFWIQRYNLRSSNVDFKEIQFDDVCMYIFSEETWKPNHFSSGLPDFSWSKHSKLGKKYNKWPQTIPNGHKLYQMAIKYSKWSWNIPTFTIKGHPKFTQNLAFLVWKQTLWQPCFSVEKICPTFNLSKELYEAIVESENSGPAELQCDQIGRNFKKSTKIHLKKLYIWAIFY
jgi:hypothetical protein